MKRLILLNIILVVVFFSCEKESQNDTSFTIKAVYDTITSCPGGGGVFIISLDDSLNATGNVELTLEASAELNASLTNAQISKAFPVTELAIKPEMNVRIGSHTIQLHASNKTFISTLQLQVEILDWTYEVGEMTMDKKDEYILWLQKNYPGLKITPSSPWFAYQTYPRTLIVHHVTLLNDDYEFRICTHVMMPPSDWSMIRLRRRNEIEPFYAARQDSTGGAFYQIPVGDYPLARGY